MNTAMKVRRLLLILLSPFWISLIVLSVVIGLATFANEFSAQTLAASIETETREEAQLVVVAFRALLLPFQLAFIGLTGAATLWVFRRRERIAGWVMGEAFADQLSSVEEKDVALPAVFQAKRRETIQQTLSSVIAVAAILTAATLALGQFISRADLAVVVAALTSSLAWGARLPIGDLLGGFSNIVETNLAVGDRILFRNYDIRIDGIVEAVDLRFLSLRSQAGELTSIPFGDLRIFRNLSRGDTIGTYAIVSVAARDLRRAYDLLVDMAPDSMALVPLLLKPWQPMSPEGFLGSVVDISLFGITHVDHEGDLQLALHRLVHERFAAAGIALAGQGGAGA